MMLSSLLYDVRLKAPLCPDFVLLDAMQRCCKEFFVQTGAWRETFDPVTLVSGQQVYEFDVPYGAQIERIEGMKFVPTVTTPPQLASEAFADTISPTREQDWLWLDQTATGPSPRRYMLTSVDGTFQVWPTPDSTVSGTVNAVGVFSTIRAVTQIPDFIGERWREALVAGTIGRVCSQPEKKWSNPTIAGTSMQEFWDYVGRARRDSVSGQYAGPLTVRMRRL